MIAKYEQLIRSPAPNDNKQELDEVRVPLSVSSQNKVLLRKRNEAIENKERGIPSALLSLALRA